MGRFSRDGTDYATCLVSFLPGRLLAEARPAASLAAECRCHAGPRRSRSAGVLSPFPDPPPGVGREAPARTRGVQRLASNPRRCGRRVERVAAAFRGCLPRLRGLRSQAIHGDCHAAQFAGGCRRPIDLRHSGFRRHDSCAADLRAGGRHVGITHRSGGAAGLARRRAARLRARPDPATPRKWRCSTTSSPRAMPSRCWCMPGADVTTARAPCVWKRRRYTASARCNHLLSVDRQALTRSWHEAAGTWRSAGGYLRSRPASRIAGSAGTTDRIGRLDCRRARAGGRSRRSCAAAPADGSRRRALL